MARRKSGGSGVLIGIALVVWFLASIPKEVWGVLLVIGGVALVLWAGAKIFGAKKEVSPAVSASPPEPSPVPPSAPLSTRKTFAAAQTQEPARLKTTRTEDESFGSFVLSTERGVAEHQIPAAPPGTSEKCRWIPAGETVSIAGFSIPGGLLYLGSGPRSGYGVEPALINPALKVTSSAVDVSLRLTDYWPSYSTITPDARRAYLQWLAGGRKDPAANIGYVFLFFYGLERRILMEAPHDSVASADIPAIKAEVRRLLGIYRQSNSFRQYATNFLAYLESEGFSPKTYLNPPPSVGEQTYELPLPLKVGLGQLAADQKAVPASWAHAWVLADPNIVRRTAVNRCSAEFEQLFMRRYTEAHGEGIVLKQNRTKLQFSYRPASGGFGGQLFSRSLGDLPDVSAVKGPLQKLQALVDDCTVSLDPYSRFVGRNPDKAQSLEGLLQLPVEIWPVPVKSELEELKSRVGDGLLVMTFGELSGRLKSAGPLSRDKVLGLVHALESLHLGMEPDVLAGNRIPKAEDKIALFATLPEDGEARTAPVYQAAAVTLDLACATAHSDGEASAHELLLLTRHVDSWSHLSPGHRKRLKAHLRLGIDQPPTLAALKRKLEPLASHARRSIVRFLAHLTQADGVVSPQEVKFLERTYKALDLDAKLVYSDLHASEAPEAPVSTEAAPKKTAGFSLDPVRIAQLQKETAEVSALLANVFVEELAPQVQESEVTAPEEESQPGSVGILGLDADHSAFLRLLISRRSWVKAELADAAADMELMLDGALEHINEAAFDAFDAPLTDGDDPIEINLQLLEALPL